MPDSLPTPWAERRPKKQTILVEDFRVRLGEEGEELARLANGLLESAPEAWTQRHLVHLYRSATEVETLLDDHGARRNEVFLPFPRGPGDRALARGGDVEPGPPLGADAWLRSC